MTDSALDAQMLFNRGDFSLDLSLVCAGHKTVALLGPNGAGKSTVVRLIGGLERLEEGHITHGPFVMDEPARGIFVPPHRRRVGIVFQDYLLFEHMDLLDNVAYGARSLGLSRRAARKEANVWLEGLGLGSARSHRPTQLSGGQAQRVALARAFVGQPDILLLDEPFAALDVQAQATARQLLAEHLPRFEGPRVLITHDPTEAFLLADEVVVLENGRLTQQGTPDEIRRRPATSYVAALAGTNLLRGRNDGGSIRLDEHNLVLSTDNTSTNGSVLLTVHPRAIALHAEQPHGSPRNTWPTEVRGLEHLGDIVRVELGDPLPIAADITPAGAEALALRPGSRVWAAVKATEVEVSPA